MSGSHNQPCSAGKWFTPVNPAFQGSSARLTSSLDAAQRSASSSRTWTHGDSNPKPSPCKGDALPIGAMSPCRTIAFAVHVCPRPRCKPGDDRIRRNGPLSGPFQDNCPRAGSPRGPKGVRQPARSRLVDLEGVEPSTDTLPACCSTVVATGPWPNGDVVHPRPARHSVVKHLGIGGVVLQDGALDPSSRFAYAPRDSNPEP